MNPAIETTVTIAPDHPAFAGHFPGTPIVPGVVLLDEALNAIRAATGAGGAGCRIGVAKFLRPVRPGAVIVIRQEAAAGGGVRFDILVGADKVATGTVQFDPDLQS
ncbi:MAG: hypothetical protein ABI831_21020 [Betaproteobacteria bacterium]